MAEPYILRADTVSPKLSSDLETARLFWRVLPNAAEVKPKPVCEEWSCHALARAVLPLLSSGWIVFDGWFMRVGSEHAWLYREITAGTEVKKYVLDIYPVAGLSGPVLIDVGSYGSPWGSAYHERRMAFNAQRLQRFEVEGKAALAAFRKEGRRLTSQQKAA
jgi:hypothetical protein